MHQLRLFFIALQFFTRIPIPSWVGFQPAWLNQAARYFPLVGSVIGVVAATMFYVGTLIFAYPIALLLSMLATILMTGAFHEDGLADMCDGMGGGHTPERVMEIMRDSRIGTYGMVGLLSVLALKFACLLHMTKWEVMFALVIAHPLSRLFSCSLIMSMNYASQEGKAKPLAQHMSVGEFLIGFTTTLLTLVVGVSMLHDMTSMTRGMEIGAQVSHSLSSTLVQLSYALIAMSILTLYLARLFKRKIGGYTGDCLGAVQQVTEVMCYLVLCALF